MLGRRMSENNLTGAIPTSLGRLASLQELKLQKNFLSGSIPMSLGNIKALQYLYVFATIFAKEYTNKICFPDNKYLEAGSKTYVHTASIQVKK
jgi:Leucine-rich repeat (LRR) protein